MKKIKKILRGSGKILFLLYDFVGLRYIKDLIITPIDAKTGKRKPITFFLWFVGIYMAIFGIASQRYESRVNVIEDRISSINAGLNAPQYKKALGRIAETQNMPCPTKPDILKPHTAFMSLFHNDIYNDGVEILKTIIENWSDSLADSYLVKAILYESNLVNADLSGTDLNRADLQFAYLMYANLSNAHLSRGKLSGAKLLGADLSRTNLNYTDMMYADMNDVKLLGADLINANLSGADLSGADLSGADLMDADLSNASLNDAVLKLYQLKETHLDKYTTMMDGTKYDESWAKRIEEAVIPEDFKKKWNLP